MLGEFLGEVLLGAQTDSPNVAGVGRLVSGHFRGIGLQFGGGHLVDGTGDGTCLLIKHGTYHD